MISTNAATGVHFNRFDNIVIVHKIASHEAMLRYIFQRKKHLE
jgi:hypothetical protein